MRKNWLIYGGLIAAYLYTWIYGSACHSSEVRKYAVQLWSVSENRNRSEPDTVELYQDGPKSGIDWCIPILPGVLLADSYYSAGPLCGVSGPKLVFFYGFGTQGIPILFERRS